jgi:wyosine [tRNA(Phe)-imidazoG37] synthetase (radical SAM superfamily)
VPLKVCTLDCVYCQLGRTSEKTIERKEYAPVGPVLAELKERLAEGVKPNFITISGSGEPTLNSKLGEIVDGIRKITDIPVAILTNGTLLCRADVRKDCAKADVVMPSLDAGDDECFRKINRPHRDISIESLIEGLCAFRKEFAGRIWLEVFFVEGLNTDSVQIAKIRAAVERIRPDKVQLNTAVRPAAEPQIKRVTAEKLQNIAAQLGKNCKVIADFSPQRHQEQLEGKSAAQRVDKSAIQTADKAEYVLSMLKRRPCSLDDICAGLDMRRNEVLKWIDHFQKQGVVRTHTKDGIVFFKAV